MAVVYAGIIEAHRNAIETTEDLDQVTQDMLMQAGRQAGPPAGAIPPVRPRPPRGTRRLADHRRRQVREVGRLPRQEEALARPGGPAQPGRLKSQVATFGHAGRAPRRRQVVGGGRRRPASSRRCAAGREQTVMPHHPFVRRQRRERSSPAAGPCTMARATARLRLVNGFGAQLQQVIQGQDLRPVRVGHPRGLIMHGGDRGLQLVGADFAGAAPRRPARFPRRSASGPIAPVLFGQRHHRPSRGCGPPVAHRSAA